MLTAAVIALTLVLFTPLFYYLPKAILAAIIMVAVFGLVDLREARHLYAVQRADFLLMLVTVAATLVLGIEAGILTGVVVSLLAVLHRISRPRCAVLGRLPGTALYRDVARHPEAETLEGVLVLRVDAQLYFGNIDFLSDKLRRAIAEASHPVRAVVLNAESVNHVDSSAAAGLAELVSGLRTDRIDVFFASVRPPVLEVMRRSGLVELAGEDHFAYSVDRATGLASTHVGGEETAAKGSIFPAPRRATAEAKSAAPPVSDVPAVAAVVPRTILGPAH
jgi:SulP family sulfate permease